MYGPPQFTQLDVEHCLKSLLEEGGRKKEGEEVEEEEEVKMKKEEEEEEEEEKSDCQKNICSLCKVRMMGYFEA